MPHEPTNSDGGHGADERSRRSRIMAAIHSKDTKPELIVRRYLFACGFRYRLTHKGLPGHPDIVLRRYRTVVFVNGCFWHGHDCGAFRLPKTNVDFWRRKIEGNRKRDIKVQQQLATMGWHCITVWECELSPKRREQTLRSLEYTLNSIFLHDHERHYTFADLPGTMAAEPEPNI